MKLCSLFALAFLTALCHAQQPSVTPPNQTQPASQDTKELASIEGRTVSTAGQPIRKVVITLRRMEPGASGSAFTATSDAEGKFAFPSLEPGRYTLYAEKAGFLRQAYGAKQGGPFMGQGTPLALTAGQHLKSVSFELSPQAGISGRVLDDEGDPVGRAMVQVYTFMYRNGKRRPMGVQGQPSDELGEFKISSLAPGRYYVCASRPMSMMGAESAKPAGADKNKPEEAFVFTCYPNATDLASAAVVDITTGRDVPGIDIRLRKSAVVSVSGKVSGDLPVEPLRLQLMPLDANGNPSGAGQGMGATANKDGTFTVYRVPPGVYRLVAYSVSERQMQPAASQRIDVGNEKLEGVTLSLVKPALVKGLIKIDGQSTASSSEATRPTVRVGMIPVDEGSTAFVPNVTAEADGSFTFPSVSPGKYRVQVFPMPEDTYLKSVRAGNQEALETGVDFSNGVTGNLEITLKAAAGRVEGTVNDENDKLAAGATVMVVPDPINPDLTYRFLQGVSDQNGQFTIKNVPPGSYRVYAFEALEYGAQTDAELMKQLSSGSATLKLDESGHETVSLKRISGKAVEEARSRAGK